MKNVIAVFCVIMICFPWSAGAELFNNPASNVGKKNLVVGAEFQSIRQEFELDEAKTFPVSSERIQLKVTAGLTDWFDIYIKGGGADLLLDYKECDKELRKQNGGRSRIGCTSAFVELS